MKTCVNIINNLYDYLTLLKHLESIALRNERIANSDFQMVHAVSIEYNTITLSLHTKNQTDRYDTLYFKALFHMQKDLGTCKEIYCVNTAVENELNAHISNAVPDAAMPWDDNKQDNYSKEIIDYLRIADRIANAGHLCSAGDDYSPGFFSKIIASDTALILKQINRHNSRSIDHKQDYHMRELEIIIPTNGNFDKRRHGSYYIGNMIVDFSDQSSPKNKTCGDRILKKIAEEKAAFDSR